MFTVTVATESALLFTLIFPDTLRLFTSTFALDTASAVATAAFAVILTAAAEALKINACAIESGVTVFVNFSAVSITTVTGSLRFVVSLLFCTDSTVRLPALTEMFPSRSASWILDRVAHAMDTFAAIPATAAFNTIP